MKILISEQQYTRVSEAAKKSTESVEDRFNYVADTIIKYMDKYRLVSIPGYRFLAQGYGDVDLGIKMKTWLEKNLNKNEYDGFVKAIILKKRPRFSYTKERKLGANNYLIEDGVAVKSLGEVVLYNTFKLNGIKLEYENPKYNLYYFVKSDDGNRIVSKNPDFYWASANIIIEVAGMSEGTKISKDYGLKLAAAQEQYQKTEDDYYILDYYKYKDDLNGFYKLICDTFNFEYKFEDFWKVIQYKGLNKERYRKIVNDLIKKGSKNLTRGERFLLNKYIKLYLTKPVKDTEGEREVPYKGVVDYKQEMGLGYKWVDEKYRKKVQKAWCKSTGSVMGTYNTFRELFPNETISKKTFDDVVKRFPQEFNKEDRDNICKQKKV